MIARQCYEIIMNMFHESQLIYLNGARQSGKSTLALQIAKVLDMEYITFDDTTMFAAANNDPDSFIRGIDTNLVLDEIQMVPEIFRSLKQYIDESRTLQKKHKILLTGSANIMALPKLSDALVGRMRIVTLHPFSLSEYRQTKHCFIEKLFNCNFKLKQNIASNITIVQAIKAATFPEVSISLQDNAEHWFSGYLTTLIRRDIRDLANIEKLSDIPTMLKVLATRVGSLINESSLARDSNVNLMTFRRYRALLENMFIIFRVYPWFKNLGKRLVKTNKNYFSDTYMLCHILGIDLNSIQQKDPILFGHILENFIATELIKALSSIIGITMFHFRTQDNYEVDFVLEKNNGDLVGIEVKSSSSVSLNDFKGLKTLKALVPDSFKCGVVLYTGNNTVQFAADMFAVPIMSI